MALKQKCPGPSSQGDDMHTGDCESNTNCPFVTMFAFGHSSGRAKMSWQGELLALHLRHAQDRLLVLLADGGVRALHYLRPCKEGRSLESPLAALAV